MYKNFLLQHDFWPSTGQTDDGQPKTYMKHDEMIGGIYAYLQHRGVKIVANNESRFFNNFDKLEDYLDKLYLKARSSTNKTSSFMQILNRRDRSKVLRKIPL